MYRSTVSRRHFITAGILLAAFVSVFLFNIYRASAAGNTWYVNAGATPGGDGTSYATATTSIQAAINAASAGDTIYVYPGNYDETAPGSTLTAADGGGTYQFGLFLPANKPGLTIVGVAGTGNHPTKITDSSDIQAHVTTNSTANFGPDGVLVEGDNDTIQALDIGKNTNADGDSNNQANKTIEDIANNFTLKDSEISEPEGGDIYVDDFQGAGVAVQSYTIVGNVFANGATVDIASGAGGDGTSSASGRVIKNNTFTGAGDNYPYALISFDGSGGVPWYAYPVGGAIITGNDFSNAGANGTQYIRARGTYFNSQFDWKSYWNNNKFPASVMLTTDGNLSDVQTYSYTSAPYTFTNVRRIGSSIQNDLANAVAGDTLFVGKGTYNGDVTPAVNNLTIKGQGSPTINLTSGYGINLDNNIAIANFEMDGFTINASPSTTYALKAYHAKGLTLNNDTFNGGAGNTGGGVDINTTSNVTFNNVISTGFHKNGFADTPAYTAADNGVAGSAITFNNVTASNNGRTGISFYTVGNAGGSASISGVKFTGTDTISGNGAGIFLEGDSDAHFATFANPANTITTGSKKLDLTHAAFSGNTTSDIINYQTANVNAIGATFDPGAITGDQMIAAQRSTEDSKIIDQLDHSNLGLVTYYSPTITVTIDKFIDGKAASTTGATASFPMQATWNATNIGSGTSDYNLSTTGYNSPNHYEAVTSQMTDGAAYATNEMTGGSVVGADCSGGQPFQLAGYTSGNTFAQAAAATASLTVPSFTNLENNAFVIVWNKYCVPAPANQTPANNVSLASADWTQATWTSVSDPIGGITYFYESSNSSATNTDGSFTTPVYQSSALNTNSIATTNTPEGTYYWHVRAEDADGNYSAWSAPTEVTVDNSPSATTVAANPIADTSATINGMDGSINADNTSFWWGTTNAGPFTASASPSLPSGWNHDSGLGSASANGTFNETLSGLTSGTTYYFIAWIEVNGTWYPGTVMSFTTTGTMPSASVTTVAATSIDQADATLNGKNGGLAADETSFWWGTTSTSSFTPAADPSAEFPSGWSHDSGLPAANANASFGEPLNGLTPNTIYYYAAWAHVGGVWYPGTIMQFTTQSNQPSVTTNAATNPSMSDATMNATNGPIDAQGESFWVSTSTINTSSANIPANVYSTPVLNPVSANGNFSDQLSLVTNHGIVTGGAQANMPAIAPNTTYYYVAWVEVNGTWYPGTVQTVTTSALASTPGATTDAATNLADNDATLNGTIGGVDADSESFWVSTSSIDTSNPDNIPTGVYSTPVLSGVHAGAPFSDQLSLVATQGITTGGVPENMMPITPSTTYYYVAWAHVNGQWYNGAQQSVTTAATPVLPAPVANNQTVTAGENKPLAITLTASGDGTIDYNVEQQPAHGALSGTGANLTYTPNDGFTGSDSFTFVANNGTASDPATVSITVQGMPVLSVNGNNPAYVEVSNSNTYSDLGAAVTSPAADTNLDVSNSVDGSATSTDPINIDITMPGTHTIVYSATDGFGNSGYAARTVNVLASPTVALTSTSATDTTVSDNPIAITATFSEPVQSFTSSDITAANGSVSNIVLSGDSTSATFDVTPASNGTVTVTIPSDSVENLAGGSNADTETISFNYAAPAPTFTPSFSVGGNGPISGSSFGLPSAPASEGGQVLGASTSTNPTGSSTSTPSTSGPSCTALLSQYMGPGMRNNSSEVTLLQTFLNSNGFTLPITGFYGKLTTQAVKSFQAKYASVILTPWNLKDPTGYVYKTTLYEINKLACPTLDAPFPSPLK